LTGLTLWVERPEACPEPSVEATLRHHTVVQHAWRHAPACLPVRFGQWFRSASLLEERVEQKRGTLEPALAEVTRAGEHGLRVIDPREAAEVEPEDRHRPASGREYLEGVRRRVRRSEQRALLARSLAQALAAGLGSIIRAQRVDPLPPEHGLVSLAHLVGFERAREYERRIQAFQREHGELRFVSGGPWPPYSFVP
jgi:hypothetical protein